MAKVADLEDRLDELQNRVHVLEAEVNIIKNRTVEPTDQLRDALIKQREEKEKEKVTENEKIKLISQCAHEAWLAHLMTVEDTREYLSKDVNFSHWEQSSNAQRGSSIDMIDRLSQGTTPEQWFASEQERIIDEAEEPEEVADAMPDYSDLPQWELDRDKIFVSVYEGMSPILT